MGYQKRVKPHMRKVPGSRKKTRVRGHLRKVRRNYKLQMKQRRITKLIGKYKNWKEKSRQRAIETAGKKVELYEAQHKAAVARAKLEKVRKQSGGGMMAGVGGMAENFNRNMQTSPLFQPMNTGQPKPQGQNKK